MDRLGKPALAAVLFLAVAVLAVACWVIDSDACTGRVARLMLGWRGDARCLDSAPSAPLPGQAPAKLSPKA
jgi:hypothetical protein